MAMEKGEVLSVKISLKHREMVQKIKEEYHINISSFVRECIEKEYEKLERDKKQ